MTPAQVDRAWIPESDSSAAFTPPTTLDCAASNISEQTASKSSSGSSIPWPGRTFIIRSVATGKVVTLRHGKVILAALGGHGTIRWECHETNGWIAFREAASYMYLGYDDDGDIRCSVRHHKDWERFCVRQRPDENYVLLMYHFGNMANKVWKGFCPVGIETKDGVERLSVIRDWDSETTAWQFIQVVESSEDQVD
ncbi:hypothetical protein BKA63DRAFT_528293 [Paraphoma chrysanthemicola]|nr:hypothetical protein BKA63DRAFT_528293 [Paraphoma chrysanthemicola]